MHQSQRLRRVGPSRARFWSATVPAGGRDVGWVRRESYFGNVLDLRRQGLDSLRRLAAEGGTG